MTQYILSHVKRLVQPSNDHNLERCHEGKNLALHPDHFIGNVTESLWYPFKELRIVFWFKNYMPNFSCWIKLKIDFSIFVIVSKIFLQIIDETFSFSLPWYKVTNKGQTLCTEYEKDKNLNCSYFFSFLKGYWINQWCARSFSQNLFICKCWNSGWKWQCSSLFERSIFNDLSWICKTEHRCLGGKPYCGCGQRLSKFTFYEYTKIWNALTIVKSFSSVFNIFMKHSSNISNNNVIIDCSINSPQ